MKLNENVAVKVRASRERRHTGGRSKTIVFDIETAPLPEAELLALLPPFDPAEVKVGNLKDPEKIAAKIADAKTNHLREFTDRAALDPLTGRVLAIGLLDAVSDDMLVIAHDDEAQTLRDFWRWVQGDMGRVHELIGFNTHLFDLPFLIRRSWRHRVAVPHGIRRGRYWSEQMIDLRERWQLGDRKARGSLDMIAKHLGIGSKLTAPVANGALPGKTISGADFARLWAEDRELALDYLGCDLDLTAKLARVLGVLKSK